MGRKCCTFFDNKPCTSGYASDQTSTRVLMFPTDIEERKRWVESLPNKLKVDEVTKYMGICEKHWKKGFETKPCPGRGLRPRHPPTEFGCTPLFSSIQTKTVLPRKIDKRGISSTERRLKSDENIKKQEIENDMIKGWSDLCLFCKNLPLAVQIDEEEIVLLKISNDPLLVEFSIRIDKEMKVKAFCGSTLINTQDVIRSFKWTLQSYSQVNSLIDYLSHCPRIFENDLKHVGEFFSKNLSQFDEAKKKKVSFLCNQLMLYGKKSHGIRYDQRLIRDSLEIFLRNRNAYKLLRSFLILPCDKTLKSSFGDLGSAGGFEECKSVVNNVFSSLEEKKKICFITADEIYVKAAIRYRAGHIIGLGVDQDPQLPAKTVLAFMINFVFGTPSFIARLIPVTTLKADFLTQQLISLLQIIHDAGGSVFLVMTDNLSVNQKMFKILKKMYPPTTLATIKHPYENAIKDSLTLSFDPTHLLKNIRNNWLTEKSQTLRFLDPDTRNTVDAKWNDLKVIYKEQSGNFIKTTKLDYQSIYPNNFEKQKVSLALNIFNEKTVAALKIRNLNDTALFIEKVLKLWNILNVKGPNEGKNLNDPDRYSITDVDDPRLDFLNKMATSLKLMDSGKKGARIKGLTGDTSNAWHMTLNGLVDLAKSLLNLGVKYICLGKLQSDRIEGEFGVIRQMSGGCYLISVEQVISSLCLRRLKLYHKLEIEIDEKISKNECCTASLMEKDEDLDLIDEYFENASKLSEDERATLYFISGYVTFKENLDDVNDLTEYIDEASEFTTLVSRGKLKHPTNDLYDMSLYLYTFFKSRSKKCCSKIFLEAYDFIYQCCGYEFDNVDSILRRFNNCFFKGFAKEKTDKIRIDNDDKKRKKRKLNNE